MCTISNLQNVLFFKFCAVMKVLPYFFFFNIFYILLYIIIS